MKIAAFPVGPLGCNCSIVFDEVAKTAIVVDPGGDFPAIREVLEAEGLRVTNIVHTHTHIDHVGATPELQDWSGAGAHIHEGDRFLYDMLPIQAAMLGVPLPRSCEMTSELVDGAAFTAGAVSLGVVHTPGHTPGSVCFVVDSPEGGIVFSGDTLFKRGIGRTDLWGGDGELIMKSLRDRLLTLPDDTLVVPGHGPETTIGDERRGNPFLRR
ncbi:MAG TPA: MBL fold metallo-hydrolase [Polyangiaceae bacterium]|nr:MBL fold metallo-hydrolase [Polyangiaceae bacterium]